MFNVFENLSQEQESELRYRIERLGISEEDLNSLYIPYMVIDEISDEELLNQLKLKKESQIIDEKEHLENEIKEAESELDEIDSKIEEIIKNNESNNVTDLSEFIDDKLIEETKKIVKKESKKQPKTEKAEKKEKKAKKSTISDDELLSKLTILDVSSFQAFSNYNNAKKKEIQSTYEVVLPQSGYKAKMRGLKADEVDMLKNSINASADSSRQTLEKVVYSCIEDTGIPNFSFTDFQNGTSVTDFDVLLFGILHQTYGELNDFGLTCNHCGNNFNRKIITTDLIQAKEGELQGIVESIAKSMEPMDTFNNSMLNKYKKLIRIPDTDMIIEVTFSSLNRERKLLPYFNDIPAGERSTRRFSITLSARSLLLPQYDSDGNLMGHARIESPLEIFNFLEDVKSSSFYTVIDEINKIIDEYTIMFKTPEIKCPKCGEMVNRHNVSIGEYFLYQTLTEGL